MHLASSAVFQLQQLYIYIFRTTGSEDRPVGGHVHMQELG